MKTVGEINTPHCKINRRSNAYMKDSGSANYFKINQVKMTEITITFQNF